MKVLRSLTVEFDYWTKAQELARKRGLSMSSLISKLLKEYVEKVLQEEVK